MSIISSSRRFALQGAGALFTITGILAAQSPPKLATASDRFLTRAGVTIRYREVGRGEPIVLIHGYTDRLEMWTEVADSLASANRVIAMDVRGFGLSSKSADSAFYGQRMVDDVVALLDHLRLPRAHVVGYSMGAMITANLVVRHPSRLASATLVGAPLLATAEAMRAMMAPHLVELERTGGLRGFMRAVFPDQPDSLVAAFDSMAIADNDRGSILAAARTFPELIVAGQSPGAVPLLAIAGTRDPFFESTPELARQWPKTVVVRVPGADHLTILWDPSLFRAIKTMARPAPVR